MSEVVKTTDQNEVLELINTGETVVVDFSAPAWCVPCQRLAPHFEAAAQKSSATFVEVDVDSAPWAMVDYGVQAVPTVLLFKNKEFYKRITGRTVVQLLQDVGE